jgi:hypothetical protein
VTWEGVAAILGGAEPPAREFDALSAGERESAIEALLAEPVGRRWLRGRPGLDPPLAAGLLEFEADFRTRRRDQTLAAVVAVAPRAALVEHAPALAVGPAASALWQRLASDQGMLGVVARTLVSGDDELAAETALALLVADPLDPFQLGDGARAHIAGEGLASVHPAVRGLAAEYLAEREPWRILAALGALVRDTDERLRAIAWRVGLRQERGTARDLAFAMLGDESVALPVRRSALLAAGEHLPTDELVELLTWFVAHPDPDLAGDAANLLHELHRNPLIAEAALHSPHAHVRETAERLLDPLRGSPAAGGNRPGSPVDTSAIFEDLIRRETERRG